MRGENCLIKTILVDDEKLALTALENKLRQFPNIQIVQSYMGDEFSIDALSHLDIDVIFLDIEMGQSTGLELASNIQTKYPHIQIVFVTAHSEYAVQAFEINSLDYLLKPITPTRLEKTINRIIEKKKVSTPSNKVPQSPLVVHCFGEFRCFHNNSPVSFKTAKVKELFAYFIIHHDTPIHRDILIEALWPEQDYNKSKTNLHTCLSHLRKQLSNYGLTNCISLVNHSYSFSLGAITSDVKNFQELADSIQRVDENSISIVDQCIDLYKGALFELNYYNWSSTIAEQLSNKYAQLLEGAIEFVKHLNKHKTLYYLQLQLPLFPYNDQKVKECMLLLNDHGYRNEAIKLYLDYKLQLEHDLEITPSKELETLYQEIMSL